MKARKEGQAGGRTNSGIPKPQELSGFQSGTWHGRIVTMTGLMSQSAAKLAENVATDICDGGWTALGWASGFFSVSPPTSGEL
ncbi:unnamed protein product [[Candida] boidinii]|uniref:Unnamed protein product n=1 Tax=Candida boidinii TaxID=5477 RepID=A0A9W6W8G9_CANBO|nr:unnamed protein product [[Candida] boidinii]GMF02769.1 unnamed protein product [[Candida] boidinii]GMF60061.1 unnamed protein product [[Candida] boidinii]